MLNLLSNGVKYNNPNGELLVSCEKFKDSIKIYVQDKGIGIDDQELSLIFEPFYRSPHIPTDVEGTGIGLPVAKQLIELMDGTIEVTSKEGEGSCFTITLPLLKR